MSKKTKLRLLAVLLCSVMGSSAMAVETTITEETTMPAAEGGFSADQIQPLTQVSQAALPESVTNAPIAPAEAPATLNSYNGGTPMPGTPAATPAQPSGVTPTAPKVMPGDSTTVASPVNPVAAPSPPINAVPGAAVPNSIPSTQQPTDNTLPPKPQIAPPM